MASIVSSIPPKKKTSNSKMPFSSPAQQQAVANRLLKDAMMDERSKRWTKVSTLEKMLFKNFKK